MSDKNIREAFEEHHPLMGLVSWSDFDDCYTALTDSGLDLAEERTLQFRTWRLAWTRWQSQQARGEAVAWRVTDPERNIRFVMDLKDPEKYQENYPGFLLEKCVLAGPAPAAVPEMNKALSLVYFHAYRAGHHDTVEGDYVDVHRVDRFDYHADIVEEMVDEDEEVMGLLFRTPAPAPLPEVPIDPVAYIWRWKDGDGNSRQKLEWHSYMPKRRGHIDVEQIPLYAAPARAEPEVSRQGCRRKCGATWDMNDPDPPLCQNN